jgi:type IV secretory pathway TraG/TraD family ATPase VirD4
VVGASGYGKSVLLSKIIKDRIQRGKGLLFIDLKADRETIAQVKQYCGDSSRGSDLKIFSISNPDISNSYNPFLEGTANQIRDRMIGALEWSEEFYKQSSSSHLLKVLRFLCWRRDEQGTSFHVKDILDLISRSDTVELYLDGIDPAPAEIQVLASDLMAFFESRERVNALMGIRCQLESLVESDFSRLLTSEESDISLFDDINAGKIVYMLLDSRRYGESARVMGKLILGDLKAASSRIDSEVEKRNRKSFNVIVDEFADLATNDFLAFLDRARSAKIGVVMAHQELGDLKRVSGEFAQRLMGNTSTLYAFLQKNPDSAETISQIAGTKEQVEYTSQMERQGFWHVATGAMSARVVEAFRVHPNQIKSLSVGRCVVLGQMPRQRAVCVKIAL